MGKKISIITIIVAVLCCIIGVTQITGITHLPDYVRIICVVATVVSASSYLRVSPEKPNKRITILYVSICIVAVFIATMCKDVHIRNWLLIILISCMNLISAQLALIERSDKDDKG